MRRLSLPASARFRWPLALLLVSIGVTAAAAVDASRAVRSQRATAERALQGYASFAAWSYQQHFREALTAAAREVLGPVNHGHETHTSPRIPHARELAHYLDWDSRCFCHQAAHGPNPGIYFGFKLGTDTVGVGVNTSEHPERGWVVDRPPMRGAAPTIAGYDAAERAWVNDTLTNLVRSGFRSDWGFAYVVGEFRGKPHYIAYTLMPTAWGDTIVYGVEYAAKGFEELMAQVLDRQGILPAALTDGRSNREMLSLEVMMRGHGPLLFASDDRRVWELDASQAMAPSYGGMVIHAQIRPDLAGELLIGGLPRSRLPLLLGMLGLAAALSIVAVTQLRREGELARIRSDFVSSVSHELRTPLAQIRLYVETMRLGRFATEAQRARAVEHIDRETRRLSHLVENVLRFARGSRGRSEASARRDPVDVARETAEIVAEFEPLAAARRAQVVVEFAEPTPAGEVHMRPGTFRQVLLNLLDNAVKYGPVSQTVRVRVTSGVAGPPESVRIAVIDEGPGVMPSEREAIWRPFQRGTAARDGAGGSGIGLTVVKEIVDEHGGRVWVEDASLGGAAFVVELLVRGGRTYAPTADGELRGNSATVSPRTAHRAPRT
ncbi:MAG: HAMP domain-containing histidine kinase [Gemmatimonadota bacterium]|nr:HAMP domain-containing histidine kinase [Gemmatimonadota bacterium]